MEALLVRYGVGPYCFGEAPTLADCCLIPQVANAQRMGCDVSQCVRVMDVFEHCNRQAAFQEAAPVRQPDFIG